jgi:hypothetical protein
VIEVNICVGYFFNNDLTHIPDGEALLQIVMNFDSDLKHILFVFVLSS